MYLVGVSAANARGTAFRDTPSLRILALIGISSALCGGGSPPSPPRSHSSSSRSETVFNPRYGSVFSHRRHVLDADAGYCDRPLEARDLTAHHR